MTSSFAASVGIHPRFPSIVSPFLFQQKKKLLLSSDLWLTFRGGACLVELMFTYFIFPERRGNPSCRSQSTKLTRVRHSARRTPLLAVCNFQLRTRPNEYSFPYVSSDPSCSSYIHPSESHVFAVDSLCCIE